jgi:hypothetical protein
LLLDSFDAAREDVMAALQSSGVDEQQLHEMEVALARPLGMRYRTQLAKDFGECGPQVMCLFDRGQCSRKARTIRPRDVEEPAA